MKSPGGICVRPVSTGAALMLHLTGRVREDFPTGDTTQRVVLHGQALGKARCPVPAGDP